MLFWQGFIALSALASIFVLWPTLVVHARKRRRELSTENRSEVNELVYTDQLKELEATHGRGEINPEELQNLKQDLEKTMTYENSQDEESDTPIVTNWHTRLPVLGLVLAIPVLALLIYTQVGAKADWEIFELKQSFFSSSPTKEDGEALLLGLQNRLEDKPKHSHNWFLLGHTATSLGDHDEAVRAFRSLLELEFGNPDVLAELAQSLFRRAGTITPEVRKYINLTLEVQPEKPAILGLAGFDAFQTGRYQQAIDHWTLAISRMPAGSADYQALEQGITQAKTALGQSAEGGGSKSPEKKTKSTARKSVAVTVSLGKEVDADKSSVVFVYARAWQGPRMPLAIQRLSVADLPKTIKLDESMAMSPSMTLGSVPQVEIVARISKSGSAVAQAGDWQASAGPIVPGEQKKKLKLEINKKIE